LHIRRGFQKRGEGQFQAVRPALADDPVEHRALGGQKATRLGTERARVAQADMALDARAAAVVDRQRVDRGAEMVEQHLADFGLGQVAQNHRIIQINRAGEQVIAHERFDLRIELVVAAHQAQVFEKLTGEEANHRSVVCRAVAVELDRVIDLGIQHGLEDDFAGLFRREGLDRQFGVAERRWVEFCQVFELPIEAAGEPGQRNIQRIDVFVGGVLVDLDNQGILRSCPPAPPMATRSKVTPSLWMDSTNSMKAGVPMTETVSRSSLPKYMRRRPRPRVCSGRMLLLAA
jgi:hypothetical protein